MSDVPVIQVSRWSSAPSGDAPLLVLLHGYGSDESDLLGLLPHLPEGIDAVALGAPLTPPPPAPGRSWFPIGNLEDRDPAAITAAGHALLAWLDEEVDPARPLALLGFSQGAAVSLQAMRLAPERFGAVVVLAGYAAPGELPGDADLRTRPRPVFWGRGAADAVIPAPLVAHTAEWLPLHADLTARLYPGLQHSVSLDELEDVAAFLRRWRDA